jgi:hypothetical protein
VQVNKAWPINILTRLLSPKFEDAGMTQFDEQEAAMESPRMVFMGSTIFPIVAPIPSGFSSMVIIVDGNQEQRGSGSLGTFETRDDAFKCAIEHAKAEIRRHCLMTIIC